MICVYVLCVRGVAKRNSSDMRMSKPQPEKEGGRRRRRMGRMRTRRSEEGGREGATRIKGAVACLYEFRLTVSIALSLLSSRGLCPIVL